jgi:hypothetical protein
LGSDPCDPPNLRSHPRNPLPISVISDPIRDFR